MKKYNSYVIMMHVDFIVENHDVWYHSCYGCHVKEIILDALNEIFKYDGLTDCLNYIEFKLYKFPKEIYENIIFKNPDLKGINAENLLPTYINLKDYESVNYTANFKDAFIIYNFPISNKSFRFL